MGVRLKVGGSESIELKETNITGIKFGADIPYDSNARSSDLGSSVFIEGKIRIRKEGEEADDTSKLAKWSLVGSDKSDCYRNVQIVIVSASQIVRQITIPNAFVVQYEEEFTDDTGIGTFRILIKQKKDKMKNLKFEGCFSEETAAV